MVPGALIARGEYAEQNPRERRQVPRRLPARLELDERPPARGDRDDEEVLRAGRRVDQRGVDEEGVRHPADLRPRAASSRAWTARAATPTWTRWFGQIAIFMRGTGAIQTVPQPTDFITDEYMKRVHGRPEAARVRDRTRSDAPAAEGRRFEAAVVSASSAVGHSQENSDDRHLSEEGEQDARDRNRDRAEGRRPTCWPRSRRGGEAAVRDYAQEARPVGRRDRADAAPRSSAAPPRCRRRCGATSTSRSRRCSDFAQAQRDSMREFSVDLHPGVTAGPARAAGQRRRLLRAGRPLRAHRVGLHGRRHREGGRRADRHRLLRAVPRRADAPVRAVRVRQAPAPTSIMTLGGVQAIATMAYGLFSGKPADVIVGPGQQVRRRGEAHAVRQGRHRCLRRARPRSR